MNISVLATHTGAVACLLFAAPTFASSAPADCNAKRQSIEQQLKYAEAHHNSHQAAGLRSALANVNQYCTPERMQAERDAHERKLVAEVDDDQRDVNEEREKLSRHQENLRQARDDGDHQLIDKLNKKISKAQKELDDDERDLARSQRELDEFRRAKP
ncbi:MULTISPECIES: DUF1090 domain-containing protein [Silvimonas]|uniref:DUF1090 domain-containing protein n=1 Tax=Silvimonas TaxID=300264 RepID=UPI0024B3C223|nr:MULTISPECIES: DUF1090 domain-containing protein [Silvimonas]MDR3427685.1 DUF1090 domain-containing protein [Silvimonas sp.]